MKPASIKTKGRRLQKWVCAQISQLVNLPWGKDEHIAPREMGQTGPDVRLSPLAREAFPFSVECKCQERWDVPGFIRQAQANLYPGTSWLLVLKRRGERPVVVMDAEEFFKLLGE